MRIAVAGSLKVASHFLSQEGAMEDIVDIRRRIIHNLDDGVSQ
jgi:thermostable 8-oxoguanine DNA glycosylase